MSFLPSSADQPGALPSHPHLVLICTVRVLALRLRAREPPVHVRALLYVPIERVTSTETTTTPDSWQRTEQDKGTVTAEQSTGVTIVEYIHVDCDCIRATRYTATRSTATDILIPQQTGAPKTSCNSTLSQITMLLISVFRYHPIAQPSPVRDGNVQVYSSLTGSSRDPQTESCDVIRVM